GRKGSGPGSASAGLAGGLSPLAMTFLTVSRHVDSKSFATSARPFQASCSALAPCRASFSTLRKGDSTASRPGLFPALGLPMARDQMIGGSDQPDQGAAQRVLPIKLPATASNAATT